MTRICCLLGAAFLVVAMSAVVGCDRPAPTRGTGQATGTDTLTPEERTAWEKVRRRADSLCFALYRLRADEWGADSNQCHEEVEEAMERAKKLAPEPNIQAVVIVDQFKNPDPTILKWVWDDAKGVKVADAPPKSEWATSLASYLVERQRRASR